MIPKASMHGDCIRTNSRCKGNGFVQRMEHTGLCAPSAVLRLFPRCLVLYLFLFLVPDAAFGQTLHRFNDTPVREVIDTIETALDYRFLYRDALISGKMVSFACKTDDLLDTFGAALRPHGIMLRTDPARRQVLLSEIRAVASQHTVKGYVLDDRDGSRLPFATITWRTEDGRLNGAVANESGIFHLTLTAEQDQDYLNLVVSYVGYRSKTVRLKLDHLPSELAVRLEQTNTFTPEIIINSSVLRTDLDTTWHDLIYPDGFSPFGESSIFRSLEILPAVALSPAISPGLNVRGSRADGFQVLLDGAPIYSQNHFFGLYDAFNQDALQAVAFYYGVTPAQFQAPPGGTLSLVTRTGSQTGLRSSAGLTDAALRGTFEGPLFRGSGSWLLAGRHSFMDAVNWFGNNDLTAMGLDVGRRTGDMQRAWRRYDRALSPGNPSARFWDVHTKLYHESESGGRLMVSGYWGGDRTRQPARRFMWITNPADTTGTSPGSERPPGQTGPPTAALREVKTINEWGNEAGSVQYQHPFGSNRHLYSLVSYSHFYSDYTKDDFAYLMPRGKETGQQAAIPVTLDVFAHVNDLQDFGLTQRIDFVPSYGGIWSAGVDLHHFQLSYREQSALNPSFVENRSGNLFDVFAEYESPLLNVLAFRTGVRTHYFSEGNFFGISPRVTISLFPDLPVSAGVGLSRNYQFLHLLSLEQLGSSDVWITSTTDQPPGSVDNLTAGLYTRFKYGFAFQAEVYTRSFQNLRIHATTVTPRATRINSPMAIPWFHDNTARARGLELMSRIRFGQVNWTNTYALSRMTIRNPALDNNEPFRAPWDHTHQFTSHLQGRITKHLDAGLSWNFASGIPNMLHTVIPEEPEILPSYQRLDCSVSYRQTYNRLNLELRAAVFNLLARRNTWYRSLIPVPLLGSGSQNRQIENVSMEVYDLGLHPSFEMRVSF